MTVCPTVLEASLLQLIRMGEMWMATFKSHEKKVLARGLWVGMARNPRLDFIFEIHEKGMCRVGLKNDQSELRARVTHISGPILWAGRANGKSRRSNGQLLSAALPCSAQRAPFTAERRPFAPSTLPLVASPPTTKKKEKILA